MPVERSGLTHKFHIGKLEGYITANLFEDGHVGEVFITIQQQGTLERGLCDALGILISLALQSSVPLEKIMEKLKGLRFEPDGTTGNPEIPRTLSVADYIGRWLEIRFLEKEKV